MPKYSGSSSLQKASTKRRSNIGAALRAFHRARENKAVVLVEGSLRPQARKAQGCTYCPGTDRKQGACQELLQQGKGALGEQGTELLYDR